LATLDKTHQGDSRRDLIEGLTRLAEMDKWEGFSTKLRNLVTHSWNDPSV